MTQLPVPEGAQLFTKAKLAGALGGLLSGPINLPTDNLWLRSEFSSKKNEMLLPRGQTEVVQQIKTAV